MITRRALVTGLLGIIAAPAIVRASSLMQVKPLLIEELVYSYSWEMMGLTIRRPSDEEFIGDWQVEDLGYRVVDRQSFLNGRA